MPRLGEILTPSNYADKYGFGWTDMSVLKVILVQYSKTYLSIIIQQIEWCRVRWTLILTRALRALPAFVSNFLALLLSFLEHTILMH